MTNWKRDNKGLTLVEMMVGVIVIGLVSLAGWVSVSVMARSGDMARNVVTAANLLQLSQEEVRRIAQADTTFETLENCDFPPDNSPKQTCGLNDLSAAPEFTGFDRDLLVTTASGSGELKRAVVTVSWTEMGRLQQRRSVMLLARPPQPLAGNLKGFVCSETDDMAPFGGVRVKLNSTTSSASYSTTSVGITDDDGANYNFAEFDGFNNFGQGRFVLPAGTYTLSVDDERFYPYVHPAAVTIPSNTEQQVAFCLTPKPDSAVIYGDVLDYGTGQIVPTFSRARIELYEDGRRQQRITNRRNYSFTIDFDDTDPKYFTVNTQDAYRLGYVFPVGQGGAPSCNYAYNLEGYSTAVVQADGSLVCSNPYNGNGASDRLEVYPGDNLRVDLSVVPVPEVIVTGRVADSGGQPVPGATVRARWPRSEGSRDWYKGTSLQTATTDGNGNFTFSVPAVQGLFAASNPANNFLQVWARGTVRVMTCCDVVRNVNRDSNTAYAGPLFPGDAPRDIGTLIIPSQDDQCGDVGGTIIDDSTGNTLPAVNVNVSVTEFTDPSGDYLIACDPQQSGYRLPTQLYTFRSILNGYYTNESRGNDQYQRRGPNGYDVNIATDTQIDYDARMWPRGLATVMVAVFDQTTGQPMDGVAVVLDPYSGGALTQTTAGGVATFTNVPETWPPPGLPVDGYYRTDVRNHGLEINHDPANYQPHSEVIQDLRDGETRTISVYLRRNGGV